MLAVLEKVGRRPPNVQGEIATRVGKYINFARTPDDATLTRFIEAAAGERARLAKGRNPQLIRYGPLRLSPRRGVYRG